jgi:hypothetical protein
MNTNFSTIEINQRFGKHCYVLPISEGRLLKVFNAYPLDEWENIEKFRWGDLPNPPDNPDISCNFIDACTIQNYLWLEGLAPRVYEIVKVKDTSKKYWGQIVDDLGISYAGGPSEFDPIYNKAKEIGKIYGWDTRKDDCSAMDVVNGKLVDVQTFQFTKDHKDKIKELYYQMNRYGKIYYHNVPELEMNNGPRDNESRVKWMGLDKIDFTNKSFCDCGSAGGFFVRYAKDRGAKTSLGIDYPDVEGTNPVKGAYIISIELGYWSVDFKQLDLRCDKPDNADIVMFASMNYHIGIPEWLPEVTNEICIFEDNSKGRDAEETLKKMFTSVVLVGRSEEHGNKPIYHCKK